MAIDPDLRLLAEMQHSLVTTEQVRGLGATEGSLRYRRLNGDWEVFSRRVLRLRGSPRTGAQVAMAAALDAGDGAVLSHASAAAWWGVRGWDLIPAHVARERGGPQTPSPLGILHQPRALPSSLTTILDGIPVVRPELLVLQICATAPHRAERLLDSLWSDRLLTGRSLLRCLDELARSGRTGVVLLRELLDVRGPGYIPPASGLEARFDQLLRRYDLPRMRRQVDVGDDEQWCGRVDFLEAAIGHVVEVDSERHHAALSDSLADERRQQRLEETGFTVTRVTDLDVWHRPEVAMAKVRHGRHRALDVLARESVPRGA